jgi:hypothetical protein
MNIEIDNKGNVFYKNHLDILFKKLRCHLN